MSKYIDLYESVTAERDGFNEYRLGVINTLEWLDSNPDQVPGRTITESELMAAASKVGYDKVGPDSRAVMKLIGVTIIPDPEPTNAEKLIQKLTGIMSTNLSYQDKVNIASVLDARGVKAPEKR